jgi:hypothetical protein
MDHTLVRYNEAEHSQVKKYVVTPYDYNDSAAKYIARPVDLPSMQCGPGFGMMSSVADLVKYSSALDNETIISKERFKKITSPFIQTVCRVKAGLSAILKASTWPGLWLWE